MNKVIFIILFLISEIVAAQKIQVLSNNTPVSYATLIYSNNEKYVFGAYTNDIGCSDILENMKFDSIKISCVGFYSKTISIDEVKEDNIVIELNKKIVKLKEVVVSNKIKKIGYAELDNGKFKIGLSNGLEIATFIKNSENKEQIIKSVLINIKKVKKKSKYRIHLYEFDKRIKTVSKEINIKNIVYEIDKGTKGIVEIDLEKENIVFPKDGICVAIEGLDGSKNKEKSVLNKNNNLIINSFKSTSHIYLSRNIVNNVGWINWNKWLPKNYFDTFNKEYNLKKLYIPSIGLILK